MATHLYIILEGEFEVLRQQKLKFSKKLDVTVQNIHETGMKKVVPPKGNFKCQFDNCKLCPGHRNPLLMQN